jgi:hypothetical protein
MGEALEAAETAPEAGTVRNFTTSSDLQYPNSVDLQPTPSAISPAKKHVWTSPMLQVFDEFGVDPEECEDSDTGESYMQLPRLTFLIRRCRRSRNCAAISNDSIAPSKGHHTCGFNERSTG